MSYLLVFCSKVTNIKFILINILLQIQVHVYFACEKSTCTKYFSKVLVLNTFL